jgi:hypothetical protein
MTDTRNMITRLDDLKMGDMICVDQGVVKSREAYPVHNPRAYLIVDIEILDLPTIRNFVADVPVRHWYKFYGLEVGGDPGPPIIIFSGYANQSIDDRYAGVIRGKDKLFIKRRQPAIKKNKLTIADVVR